ncbi:MAG: MFS transporter [Candidatus Andeanibacterium colombiense]|uniref:MFS transporter n=1 Tax=Candidatus Andeanibacterium colombiense TaxID=3121345 RepID=A0AAJ5X7D6_9SPHN|nr:MAG: MFS transporter [Sphingomonadaceae bacterium]
MSRASPNWTLAASILASSLAFVDSSVTNVALPAIRADLHAGAADLQWVINTYLLPLSALLLLGGAAGDRFGRRRIFLAGLAGFAAASLACALAPSLEVLFIARFAQGAAAAILMPNSLSLLGIAFSGDERGRAIGTWAAAGAITAAIGPLIGGWLIDAIGWRAVFYVNLPLAAAAFAVGLLRVEDPPVRGKERLDWLGVGMATLSLGALTWGLTVASGASAIGWQGIPEIAAGLAGLALFVAIEAREGPHAGMPLALFGTLSFGGLTVLTFLLYGALGAAFVLIPYLLIENYGYSPVHAGAALLPIPVILGACSRFMGGIAARIGPRWPLTIGPVVAGIGFALAARTAPEASYWTTLFPALVVIALGMAGAVAPLTTAVMASVDGRHVGAANGFNSAVARTGGMIATALVGAVLAASGPALEKAFDRAVLAAACAAALAGLAALVMLRPREIAGTTKD